tara:strand:+ start:1232 stop:2275 length:1044 start_codon:yes stop_codon:yes gene_type:complete
MHQPIDHPSAWRVVDFKSQADYGFDLNETHLRELDEALLSVKKQCLSLQEVSVDKFDLPTLSGELTEILNEVTHGRGFGVIRGFPVDKYSIEDMELLYFGLGCHFGNPESQSVIGDRVGHVMDMSDRDPNARAYRNRQGLKLHTDLCDVITMLSVSKAAIGGCSRYASGLACYNEICEIDKEALEILCRGFHMYRAGEQSQDELPYTPHRVPVFSYKDGYVSVRYIRAYIHAAATQRNTRLTRTEVNALDLLDEVAQSPDIMLEIDLQPGDISIINNYTVMHARTPFENDPINGRVRHLLRLWLTVSQSRPVVPEINLFDTPGITFKKGQRSSGEGEMLKTLSKVPY